MYHPLPSSHSLPPRIFGCIVYVHCPKRVRAKLKPRASKCIFVGYGRNQKGYRCYDPLNRRMYTTMDCEFLETNFYYNHLWCQGKKRDDGLRWLASPWVLELDQKGQVGGATKLTFPVVQSIPQLILSDHQVSTLDVEHESLDNNIVDNPMTETVEAEKRT